MLNFWHDEKFKGITKGGSTTKRGDLPLNSKQLKFSWLVLSVPQFLCFLLFAEAEKVSKTSFCVILSRSWTMAFSVFYGQKWQIRIWNATHSWFDNRCAF